jgi:hypothetical protein
VVFSKAFFDLQLSFAEKVRALSGMSLGSALFEYTNLYVRFGLGREFDAQNETWRTYVAGLPGTEGGEADREWTYRFYLKDPEATTAPPVVATSGCFSYALSSVDRARLHFRNAETDGGSPLGAARVERRRADLSALVEHMKRTANEVNLVTGGSWLYNLDAYRRLFPPAYGSSARVVPGRYKSMTLWGQFLDHHGQVKESMTRPFLSSLAQRTSLDRLEECFPFQVLAVHAPAQEFYDFYGV